MAIHSTNEFYKRCTKFADCLQAFRNDAYDFGIHSVLISDLDTAVYFLDSILRSNVGGSCDGKKEDETA